MEWETELPTGIDGLQRLKSNTDCVQIKSASTVTTNQNQNPNPNPNPNPNQNRTP